MRYAPDEIERLRREDIEVVAHRCGIGGLRRSGRNLVGPCFLCGGGKAAGRFELKRAENVWVCAACSEGGDTISLVQRALGKTFVEACDWLGGSASVAPVVPVEPKRHGDDTVFRERERRRLWQAYRSALPGEGSPIESYFEIRRIDPDLARLARLRFAPAFAYYHGEEDDPEAARPGKRRPRVIHVGPVMLAPIIRPDLHFGGLHITYLDLARPKGKAEIIDPDSGEILPAKKVRGSKKGGWIDLIRCPRPTKLYAGEGIETVGFVWTCRRLVRLSEGEAWRSSIDLGNLGGKAAATDRVRHPTLKDSLGRARSVPGAMPDLDEPAMPIPPTVDEVIYLADGDSDAFSTGLVMHRAVARNARVGLTQRIAWAPPGTDFNDLGMSDEREAHGRGTADG